MKATINSTLKLESEIRNETYSTNFNFDEDFNVPDLILVFCENIKKMINGIDDDAIIKILETNLEFYKEKRQSEHEENYPSFLRKKPNSN